MPDDTSTTADAQQDMETTPEAEAGASSDAVESEPKPTKKRSRRSRSRKKSAGPDVEPEAGSEESGEAEAAAADDDTSADSAGAEAPEGEGEPKKKRRRRRRRRKKSGEGEGTGEHAEGGESPASSSAGESEGDDDDDVDADAERAAKRRRGMTDQVEQIENWDEIFGQQTFADLGLRNSVVKGTDAAGFKHPTKIQSELIPLALTGRDILGQSRTGTGKTAAFGLPLFHRAERDLPFQSIVLAPTRELAIQIADELSDLGRFTPIRVSAVYGGQRIHTQAKKLDRGPEIIVATPGRLMDMRNRGHLHFDNVKHVVLDEVDRMLDIGFREDIRKILGSIKTEHQTVFVSATISDEIEQLSRKYMTNPEKLVTTGSSLTVALVEQHYISVQSWDKRRLLLHLLTHEDPGVTLVFCRMKRTVDDVTKYLNKHTIDAHAIHGDMYQGKRNTVMRRMREGDLAVIVASDLAARGLDVDGITHVINYDLPEDPEIYVHRVGRTARAGRKGVAWAFVTPEQGPLLTAIEHLANIHIPEQTYSDFEPGPVPADVREIREREERRIAQLQSRTRFSAPDRVRIRKVDETKFPGGVVPTKMPPKRMQGRLKTSRSFRAGGGEED